MLLKNISASVILTAGLLAGPVQAIVHDGDPGPHLVVSSKHVSVEFSEFLTKRMPSLDMKVQRAVNISKLTTAQFVEALVLEAYKKKTGHDLDIPVIIRVKSLEDGRRPRYELVILDDEGRVIDTRTQYVGPKRARKTHFIRYGFNRNFGPHYFGNEKSPLRDRKFKSLTYIADEIVQILSEDI